MKSLSIFILLLASVFSAVSQESEEEYQNEEEYDNEDDYDNEEGEEEERTYFDFDKYFNFNNDQYSNILDKVNEMNPEEEEVLYKFIVDIQQDKVLKDRLFRELVSKVKKKSRYEGKDSPGFNCIVLGLMENKTVYDAIIKDGRTEDQARNATMMKMIMIMKKNISINFTK